ncbi:MAG TPA: DUF2752 domain-containing protein [Thermoanaerobaculia bacterium]|jgi:hypothetical protein
MFRGKSVVLVALGAAGIALVFFYRHDPSTSHFYPRCLFHALTGFECPGCGATRALYHLLHGEIAEALRFNAFFVLFSPVLTIAGAAEATAIWKRRTVNVIRQPWIGWTIVFLMISWSVFRNLHL